MKVMQPLPKEIVVLGKPSLKKQKYGNRHTYSPDTVLMFINISWRSYQEL